MKDATVEMMAKYFSPQSDETEIKSGARHELLFWASIPRLQDADCANHCDGPTLAGLSHASFVTTTDAHYCWL